jgi:hypothetical protein
MPAKYSVFSIRSKECPEWFPVGIAMWSPELNWASVRIVSEAERPKGVLKEDQVLIETLRINLDLCQSAEYLASHNSTSKPSTDEFWAVIRGRVAERFRLSQEFPVLNDNLEEELLVLYHNIVAPIIDPADWTRDSKVIEE